MIIDTVEQSRVRLFFLTLVCILVMPIIAILMLYKALFGDKLRALKMAIAIDQCGNAATGGSEDETISSRSWVAAEAGKPWGVRAVKFIDSLFGKGHCKSSQGY